MKTNVIAHVHVEVVDAFRDARLHVVGEAASAPRVPAPLTNSLDALIVRAADGDDVALATIAARLTDVLLHDAESVLGLFKDQAQDVVQDVLLALVEGSIDIGPRSDRARSWLRGVVRAYAQRQREEREDVWAREDDDERED